MHKCLICGDLSASEPFQVREMMFGTREHFNYSACAVCGSLQLLDPPKDLSRFYGEGYYAFDRVPSGGIVARLKTLRDAGHFGSGGWLGALLARSAEATTLRVLATSGLRPGQRVLDVGCGAGVLLDRLARAGFRHLAGVDPFVPQTITTPADVTITRSTLDGIQAKQDTIMFNHSLEHVPDPAADLRKAATLLPEGGRCIVRIPTSSTTIYECYGADWVQLDAPRHLSLPSRRGMAALAERTGFRLESIIDDSWAYAFWGSELIRADIPLVRPVADPNAQFGRAQMRSWTSAARALNAAGQGDQAAFVLRRT